MKILLPDNFSEEDISYLSDIGLSDDEIGTIVKSRDTGLIEKKLEAYILHAALPVSLKLAAEIVSAWRQCEKK